MFDLSLSVVVATDASNYGFGAVPQQQHSNQLKTVTFASRSLTDPEIHYSAGEKEPSACLRECEKWHAYHWGRHFAIRTDHQALVTLVSTQGTGIHPPRIACWATRLLNHNFTMQYLRGSDNVVAYALSRLPIPDTEGGPSVVEVSIMEASLTQVDFQIATGDDLILLSVILYMQTSWPEEEHVTAELRPHYNVRDNLFLIDGILFQGKKFIIPTHLQEQIIHIGHEAHRRISRTTSIIREYYWWASLNAHIKSRVQNSTVCAVFLQ